MKFKLTVKTIQSKIDYDTTQILKCEVSDFYCNNTEWTIIAYIATWKNNNIIIDYNGCANIYMRCHAIEMHDQC